jgi:SAM-dependent methyltransferase
MQRIPREPTVRSGIVPPGPSLTCRLRDLARALRIGTVEEYRSASLASWSTVAPDWGELADRIDRQLGGAADWIIDALALKEGQSMLELAGGPGTLSVMAARAVGQSGRVVYSDFSESMVDVARERLSAEGLGWVECRVIDAESIDLPDGSVDAVACRMGYMLMAEPPVALRETARVLAPGGQVALAVWADAASNPWAAVPMQSVAKHLSLPPPPPDAPNLWSLSDETRLKAIMEGAGFQSVHVEAVEDTVEFDSSEQWIEMTRRLAGPLRVLWSSLEDSDRGAVEQLIREAAAPYEQSDGRVSLPERMVVASAHT